MRTLSVWLAVALVIAAVPAAAQEVPTIRVAVRMVNVVATVRAPNGGLARELTRDDFEVLDEGQPQPIRAFSRESELPLSIALLLDASLSTARDLKFELDAANRFIRAVLRPQDRISIFSFTQNVTQLCPFTNNVLRLERALHSIQPEGATSLFDAIYLASGELKRQEGRKVIILITDGGDTTSSTNFQGALRAAQDADAVIYSVVVVPIKIDAFRDIGGEHALLLLSDGTGGRAYTPEGASELDGVFRRIGEEFRTQYVLGYYLPANAEGDYRHVTVRVKDPGFTVQARKGYYLKAR